MVDIAERLTSYAASRVTAIKSAYLRQILTWSSELQLFADAQEKAKKNIENALEEMKKRDRENAELILLASSVILSAVAVWAGAVIELSLYPRYATKTIFKDAFKGGRYVVHSEKEYSELAAKCIGDLSHENLGRGFEWMTEKIAAPKGLDPHLLSAAATGDLASYRTNLIVALNDASEGITKQLDDMYDNINNYGNDDPKLGIFGDLVLREVRRQRPRPSNMPNDTADSMELQAGKQFIIKMFDDLQDNLARNWFYYGNDPRPGGIHHACFNLELQVWALFVLKTNWRLKPLGGSKYADPKTDYEAEDDSSITLSRVAEAIRGVAGQEVIDNFYAKKLPKKGTIQEIDVDEEQSKSSVSDAVQAAGRDDGQEGPEDLSKIQAWARSVERLSFRMEMAGSPRRLDSVGKMHVAGE